MSRVVVVSGGATGIGLGAARWFAARGDRVWLVGRREARLRQAVRELGPSAELIVADLGTTDGAETVRGRMASTSVHVIVAAAGGTAALVPKGLAEVERTWLTDIRQNLLTAVLLVEALADRLVRPGGRVIGLGSIGAQLGSGYGGSYGAAKAALHAWVYWLAARLGSEGITANLVLPGYVPETEFFGDRRTPEFDALRVARTLVGRAGTVEDVAEVIGFLASPGASYVTGQLIGVSGGTVLGR